MKKKALFAVSVAMILGLGSPKAEAVGRVELQVAAFALEEGVFNNIFAKELCSCHFVDGLSIDECQARDNLPPITHQLVNLRVDEETHQITSSYKGAAEVNAILATSPLRGTQLGGPATAAFDEEHPERGCVLTELSRR